MVKIKEGIIHEVPSDLKKILNNSKELFEKWNDLTAIGRNEFVCWIISAKKDETRFKRINRTKMDLLKGKKRPCCWAGCPHHKFNVKNDLNKKV